MFWRTCLVDLIPLGVQSRKSLQCLQGLLLMKLPLRERRKIQTALDIQRATLALAQEVGFDHVTTEAIAERAGISPRTFFNYYTNKEAAAVGIKPHFPEDALNLIANGTGAICADLYTALGIHLDQLVDSGDIIEAIGELWRENSRIRWLMDEVIEEMSGDLETALATRQPDMSPQLRKALATWAMNCAGAAIKSWVRKDDATLSDALARSWKVQQDLACFLAA